MENFGLIPVKSVMIFPTLFVHFSRRFMPGRSKCPLTIVKDNAFISLSSDTYLGSLDGWKNPGPGKRRRTCPVSGGVPFGWILKKRMDSARREARPFVEPVFFFRMCFELLIICTCVKAAVFHLAISCSWVSRRNRRRKSTGIPQTPRDATAVMSASVEELYSIV